MKTKLLALIVTLASSSAFGAGFQNTDASYQEFLSKNKDSLRWFENTPVGFSGIPHIVYKLLPVVFPDLWNEQEIADVGFLPKIDGEITGLPQGLGHGMGSTQIIPLPGFEKVRMQIVNFSCAGCHTGYVRLENGELQKIIGAPNTRSDIARWRRKLYETTIDPRWNASNFKKAMLKYPVPGMLYGFKNLAQETFDRTVFFAKADQLLQGISKNMNDKEFQVQNYLGEHAYAGNKDMLNGITPGQTEAFGVGIAKFIPIEGGDDILQKQFGMGVNDFVQTALQKNPAVADIPSVWNQKDRSSFQWDGSVNDFVIRNLAASVGVIGEPKLVNYENAVITGKLLMNLPAPKYPFAVDTAKAAKGQKIFQKACAECHTPQKQKFMPIADIGTDPTRAESLTPMATQLLAGELVKACTDKNNPTCRETDLSKIVTPRSDNPGYVSAPLDGIWARAPYMHNGSIPTLKQVLVPGSRESMFFRGNFQYDQQEVGFVYNRPDVDFDSVYDTQRPGNGNQGHADKDVFFGGIDFESDPVSLEQLLEYMKTL